LSAIHFARHLLAVKPQLERCLVVGTEEAEWLVTDAFASWRMATRVEEFQVFGTVKGTVFGEGAGAVVVGREGDIEVTFSSPGQSFFSIKDSMTVARALFAEAIERSQPDFIVSSANGTFVDEVERSVFDDLASQALVYAPKPAFGETLGASSMLGAVVASLGLRHQTLPGTNAAGRKLNSINRTTRPWVSSSALVTAVGFNQQVNAIGLRRNGAGLNPQKSRE
jgi:3-oxoacyl-(acyl-carrier-protein) synthase